MRALQQRPEVRDAARARARLRRRRASPPATTRASSATRRPAATCSGAASIRPRTSRTSCSRSRRSSWRAPCSRSAIGRRTPSASTRARADLPVADKPDSQEICFVPDDDYAAFVDDARAATPHAQGAIVDERGPRARPPRRRPPLHGRPAQGARAVGSPTGAPLYVLALEPAEQQVVVGPKAALERTTLTASGVNWIAGEPPAAAARHRADPPSPSAGARHGARDRRPAARAVDRSTRRRSPITPGQAVVFYEGDVVVGGGWID